MINFDFKKIIGYFDLRGKFRRREVFNLIDWKIMFYAFAILLAAACLIGIYLNWQYSKFPAGQIEIKAEKSAQVDESALKDAIEAIEERSERFAQYQTGAPKAQDPSIDPPKEVKKK